MTAFRWCVSGILILLGAAVFSSSVAGEIRTWTSTDGKPLEAELVGSDETSVTVRRADGQQFTIPLDRLSETDQRWVAEQPAAPPEGAQFSELWGENGEAWNPEDGTLLDFSKAGYHEGANDFPDWEVGVNVKDFGAVGDGMADDTEAFQKAIAACPENAAVLVPNGTYRLMDWLGVNEMDGNWVKPLPKSRFVIRGESRDGGVLLLGVGLQEIHPWEQTTGNGRPTSQWSWSGGFLWFQDSTEVGVENLTIRGDGGRYDVHWNEPGRNGIFFRDVEQGWVRGVTLLDVDSGILVNNGKHITLQDILFRSSPDRPSTSDFENNEGISGHHAIMFGGGSSWCVADDITFENRFHHELGVNPKTNHCVYSNCRGPNLHFDFPTHEDDIENILFTEIDAGEGNLIWRNNFYGTGTGGVSWNVRGEELSLPKQESRVKHSVAPEVRKALFVGWPIRLPNRKEAGRPWFGEIKPDALYPPNTTHAQRRKRFGGSGE